MAEHDRTPLHAAEFNKLYYNPDVTYDPPFDGTGKQWPTAGARYYAQTAANTNNWVNVRADPYLLPTPATAPKSSLDSSKCISESRPPPGTITVMRIELVL